MFHTGETIWSALADDQAEEAIARADALLAAWPAPGFTSPNFHHLVATVQARLYLGQVWEAWEQICEAWPHLEREGFLRLDCIGTLLRDLRARVALAAATNPEPMSNGWTRTRLLKVVRQEVKAITRSELSFAAPFRAALEAGLAGVQGDDSTRAAALLRAAAGFDVAQMNSFSAITWWTLARDYPEHASHKSVVQAVSWLESQQVHDPIAMSRVMMGGH